MFLKRLKFQKLSLIKFGNDINKPITFALFDLKSAFFCYNKKMENVFINKMKNVLFFILQSSVMLFICVPLIFVFLIISMHVAVVYHHLFDEIIGIHVNTWYLTGVTTQIFQIIVFYFISKKLGIIKTFDELPFWPLLFIAFVYEFVFVYTSIGFADLSEHTAYSIKRMLISSLEGYGYLYTFLFYSLKRFLNKKYPNLLKRN